MNIQVRDARDNLWNLDREQIKSLKPVHRGLDVIRYDLRLYPSLRTRLGWTDKLHLSVAEGRRLAGILVSGIAQDTAATTPASSAEAAQEPPVVQEPTPESASQDPIASEPVAPEGSASSSAAVSPVEPPAPTGIDAIRAAIQRAGK